ncbi:MAG: type II toxin-antitoxin system VapC family toxin [Spirochaetia bacterium]|jgi:ribonuclease VapC|nr:type II toxin-antitoxin system VapC family toxin [Spirochaetia bacterium]
MVIDTSAILAILLNEPEKKRFIQIIAEDPVKLISSASYVEAGIVMTAKYGPAGKHQLLVFLTLAEITIADVDRDQAKLALDAWQKFGKGNHPAALNYGDCISYALSESRGEPLLFKGNNFSKTDIKSANKNFNAV